MCRGHGLSPATFYKLKSKYGGMEVSEAAQLKALEDENAKLKRLLADTILPPAGIYPTLVMNEGRPGGRSEVVEAGVQLSLTSVRSLAAILRQL